MAAGPAGGGGSGSTTSNRSEVRAIREREGEENNSPATGWGGGWEMPALGAGGGRLDRLARLALPV